MDFYLRYNKGDNYIYISSHKNAFVELWMDFKICEFSLDYERYSAPNTIIAEELYLLRVKERCKQKIWRF